jgi:NTP pyrophosphatase (non-canonical NTP hydrolase)
MSEKHKPFGKPLAIVARMRHMASVAKSDSIEMDDFLDLYDSFVNESIGLKKPVTLAGTTDDLLLLGAMGIAGEGGEVLDECKKVMYHDCTPLSEMTPERRRKIIKELGDDLWYFSLFMRKLGTTWREVIQENMDKLVAREEGAG